MADNISEIFSEFQDFINEDQDIREEIRLIVRDLEQRAREILAILQSVHQPDGLKNTSSLCEASRSKLLQVHDCFKALESKLPTNQYYRFNDHWRFVMQRLCFLAAFVVYLEDEHLIARNECAEMLGVQVDRQKGFHIDLEDFLMGLLQLATELSRLSVNAVIACDYVRPMKIAKFIAELDSGFRLLNLKNDSLRKRFDGLKYDLKKVEEVVYDLSIRGLQPQAPAAECSSVVQSSNTDPDPVVEPSACSNTTA